MAGVFVVLQAISQYEIRRKVGEGGMGVVFEGWDSRLGRHVAIKTLRGATESAEAKTRLWSEARSLARVSHPGVCQIFDVLEQGPDLYLVLEFLEGRSLADRLGSGTMNAAEAIKIERQVLEALEALHALGIVHRDLKPSNVFLTPHGVKLLDFGLARTNPVATEVSQAEAATALTAPGFIVGTPQYMAPEQARGIMAGPAADIFAAGCILYEMLAGKRAFDGASAVDILYSVLHHDPPPLSGSREIEALERVIRRAIAKRPEDRYPTARIMLDELNARSGGKQQCGAAEGFHGNAINRSSISLAEGRRGNRISRTKPARCNQQFAVWNRSSDRALEHAGHAVRGDGRFKANRHRRRRGRHSRWLADAHGQPLAPDVSVGRGTQRNCALVGDTEFSSARPVHD